MVSLVSFLDENAGRQPDHLACVVGDDSLSYAELRDASCRFAGALASLGLQPGDRVSLYMPNSAACYLGVMRAGMIANPVNGVPRTASTPRTRRTSRPTWRPRPASAAATAAAWMPTWRGTCSHPKATTTTWTWWAAARCARWKPS